MNRTIRNRIIVGIVGLILVGSIFIYVKSLYHIKQFQPWELPLNHLEWNMSIDEVKKYYELTEEEYDISNNTINVTIKEEQLIYGQKMKVTLTFSPSVNLGLTRVTGISTETDMEKLIENVEIIYGESGEYWDSHSKEVKKSYYWGSEKVQAVYSKEDVKNIFLEHWDVQKDIDSAINSVVTSTMMKDLSYIIIRTDENGNPILVMDAFYQLLLKNTEALNSDNNS